MVQIEEEQEGCSSGYSEGISSLDQSRVPFLSGLLAEKKKKKISFHMPGHKGIFSICSVELNYNIDYLLCPKGALLEAQRLASVAYGVDETYFLINGSTTGNLAALLSTTRPDEKILMSRASHRSVYTGLILSGAVPVYLDSIDHPHIDYPLAVSVESVKEALEAHPDVVVVHLTSPNYSGVVSDVGGIRELTQKRRIPLIVDEAHGSHFCFHSDLPPSAASIGADLIVQSTHKTQLSLTQASMLHLIDNGGLINRGRVSQILSLLQSTSPSSILLASLDAARSQMALEGHAHFIRVSDCRCTGCEAFRFLQDQCELDGEFADLKHLVCWITVADEQSTVDHLLQALQRFSNEKYQPDDVTDPRPLPSRRVGLPTMVFSSRDAHFMPNVQIIPLVQSVGRVLAESVIPYPPGVPLLVPGERIEERRVPFINYLLERGDDIIGVGDPSMKTIQVIVERAHSVYDVK